MTTTLNRLKALTPTLSVGILTADMMNLGAELALLETAGIALVHLDVMDGHYWPKITVGMPLVQGLQTPLLKDVHLLIDQPEKHLAAFVRAGADILTFAAEPCRDLPAAISALQQMPHARDPQRGIATGLSLLPTTPLDILDPVLDQLDIVVLLTVRPEASPQIDLAELPARLDTLRKRRADLLFFVDGGITRNNIEEVAALGSDVLVTGSAVFDGKQPRENAEFMLQTLRG